MNRTLTLAGSIVDPGTSSSVGILTVQNSGGASYNAHMILTNTATTYSQFIVDVLGGGAVAGTDHDQLNLVRGDLSGLANADLAVNIGSSLTASDLAGDILAIATNLNGTVSGVFRSVSFTPGWTGAVTYNASSIVLSSLHPSVGGTVFRFR